MQATEREKVMVMGPRRRGRGWWERVAEGVVTAGWTETGGLRREPKQRSEGFMILHSFQLGRWRRTRVGKGGEPFVTARATRAHDLNSEATIEEEVLLVIGPITAGLR